MRVVKAALIQGNSLRAQIAVYWRAGGERTRQILAASAHRAAA